MTNIKFVIPVLLLSASLVRIEHPDHASRRQQN